mgnify:CR=1 FL=1|tara:strand:- start:71182 stop:71421 length:240 start_codon:yes stop_codon:yes gene_type:complete
MDKKTDIIVSQYIHKKASSIIRNNKIIEKCFKANICPSCGKNLIEWEKENEDEFYSGVKCPDDHVSKTTFHVEYDSFDE